MLTEQNGAAAAVHRLNESEERFRVIAETVPLPLVLSRINDGAVLFINQRAAEFFGVPMEKAVGLRTHDYYERPEERQRLVQAVLRDGHARDFEVELKAADDRRASTLLFAQRTLYRGEQVLLVTIYDASERKQAEEALATSERELRLITDNVPALIAHFDRDERCRFSNRQYAELFGWTVPEILGRPLVEVIGEAAYGRVKPEVEAVYKGQAVNYQRAHSRRDGATQFIETALVPSCGEHGDVLGFYVLINDITDRKRAEQALKESEARYRLLWETTTDAVLMVGRDHSIRYANPAVEQVFGYLPIELEGQPLALLQPEHSRELHASEIERFLSGGSGNWRATQTRWLNRDGREFPVEVAVTNISLSGEDLYVAFVRDITARKQAEERINQLAHFDPLTGLPNRNLLADRIAQAIAHAHRNQDEIALMFLDLDHFKNVNDSLGHDPGDRLLKEVGVRLAGCLREGDTVGRYGGDEFVIVLPDIKEGQDADRVARKIMQQLAVPFVIDGHELHVGASIGISVYPRDGADAKTLMKSADTAMYHAKVAGRMHFRFFTPEMNVVVQERRALETSLRRALNEKQLVLHYQPQIDLASERIVSLEALVHWQHPELGLIEPSQFIAIAEETGLIGPIGEWGLKEACRQNKAWQDTGLARLPVAVNLSARQFPCHDLVATVQNALAETQLEPQCLELELTEPALMHQAEETVATLNTLSAMGVQLAIDDFGMGYSSLSYLKRFAIDRLKIDRSFVRDIPNDPDAVAIARAIIAMAHGLGLKVTAQGVETRDQVAFLRAHGCDGAQGYYFGEPQEGSEIARLLEQ
jgi:diguanylate cyclase (GGDEF)-like protein/PAS domain S-box-containing protein